MPVLSPLLRTPEVLDAPKMTLALGYLGVLITTRGSGKF